jgi:hypothetical protein
MNKIVTFNIALRLEGSLGRLDKLGPVKKIILVTCIIVATGFVIVNTNALNLIGKPINLDVKGEQAVIQKASFDSNHKSILLLDVQSMYGKTITFNTATIKNSQHANVATIVSLQDQLPAQQNMTISVDLSGVNLALGNYTLDLWTTQGHFFSSPNFAIG